MTIACTDPEFLAILAAPEQPPPALPAALAIVWAGVAGDAQCPTCKNEGPPLQYEECCPLPEDVPRCGTCNAPQFTCERCGRAVSWSFGMGDSDRCNGCVQRDRSPA